MKILLTELATKTLPYGRLSSRERNALAPDSMSLERHRLMWLFMKEKPISSKIIFALHIAPEYCFIKIFKEMKNIDYTTGDLISPWADVKMDVHDIPFEENSFDVVICNHVLEHVEDAHKSNEAEFYRVMKPGGWGIFQVPIGLQTIQKQRKTQQLPILKKENIYTGKTIM